MESHVLTNFFFKLVAIALLIANCGYPKLADLPPDQKHLRHVCEMYAKEHPESLLKLASAQKYITTRTQSAYWRCEFRSDLSCNKNESRYFLVYHQYNLAQYLNSNVDFEKFNLKKFNGTNLDSDFELKKVNKDDIFYIKHFISRETSDPTPGTSFVFELITQQNIREGIRTRPNEYEPFEETIAILKKQGRLPQDFDIDTPGFKLEPPKGNH